MTDEWVVVDGSGSIQADGFTTPGAASRAIGEMYEEGFNGSLAVISREELNDTLGIEE